MGGSFDVKEAGVEGTSSVWNGGGESTAMESGKSIGATITGSQGASDQGEEEMDDRTMDY